MTRLLTVVLVLCATAPAFAQEAGEDPRITAARARFTEGQDAYERSDYTTALDAFSEVFAVMEEVGHPNAMLVLYNVARTNQSLGRDAEALEQYDRFLREAADDAPNREEAARSSAEMRRRAAMRGSGGSADESDGGGGGISPIGPIIAAIGGAVIIGGAIIGGIALSDGDAASAGCVDSRCPPDARDGIDAAQSLANVADILLFGGLAVAATGIILTFVLTEDGDTEASASCGPTGCGAVVRGTF